MTDQPAAPPRVDWRAADLRNVSFAGVSLEGADFRAADISGSNFTNANLRYADFRGAAMHGTMFQNANLYGAKMQGVEAFEADFRGADLRQANFGGAYMEGARMPSPSPADLAERKGIAAERQQGKQPAELLSGKDTCSQQPQQTRESQNQGSRQGPNRGVKV
jgi:uncharacterized protein YjbI with pentapeptide repeats